MTISAHYLKGNKNDWKTNCNTPCLVNSEDTDTSDRLMLTIDNINNRGIGKIWFGGQRPKKDWYMKQDLKSPAYTTRWECLPMVV